MTASTPSWVELMGRHAASDMLYTSAALSYRYVTRTGDVDEGTWEFWHGPGNKWRIERSGQPILIRNGELAFSWRDDEMHRNTGHIQLHILKPISPLLFVGPESFLSPSTLSKNTTPARSPIETVVNGRRAWSMIMNSTSHEESIEFVIDDETGLILRTGSSNDKLYAELTEVTTYEDLPDEVFDWEGAIAPPTVKERSRDPEHLRQVHEMAEGATPRYWPTGVSFTPISGDPDTGELVMSLHVNGHASLARWPLGAQPTLLDRQLTQRYPHSTEWSDDRWTWRLLTVSALGEDDVRRVQESI